ncbi:MAG: FliH/SctL family protein [Planctomycetota bacterium]|nr:FliH/SctL family protein [Planctomycetota bacterium]
MALIKNTEAAGFVRQGVVLDLGDLNRQAERVLEQARAEAQRILEHSQAEAQELVAQAAQRGHAEGKEQGLAEGREQGREEAVGQFKTQIGDLITSWTEAAQRWESDRNAMLDAAHQDVLEFALAMGTKITHRTIEADPTVVTDQLAEALALLAEPTAVTVSINPEDRPMVESVLPDMLQTLSRCAHIDVREEATVSRGGCIVASGKGRIDATIERQIDRIVTTILAPASQAEPEEAAAA